MNRKWISLGALAVLVSMLAGCDTPPGLVEVANGTPVDKLVVSPTDAPLYQAVLAAENARANYKYRLDILQSFYNRMGNADKYHWANLEIKNLNRAQWFRWEGLEQVTPAPGEAINNDNEAWLVEQVISARNAWKKNMAAVATLYDERNMDTAARTVRRAVERLAPVNTYNYYLSSEIPPADLQAKESIPAANALFDEGMKLYKDGKILPAITDYRKEHQAIEKFQQLIHDHPASDRIGLAAYFIAEIYKEYFNENVRAVHWYERAWQWDPNITQPARFQCAVIYDLRMKDYPNAIKCYRLCLKYDVDRLGNFDFARKRLKDLTGSEQ